MNNEDIERIALTNGFKLKEQADGSMALNPYVFDFARALLSAAPTPPEVEPIFFVSPSDIEKVLHRDIGAGIFAAKGKVGVNTVPVYTSPPSPKAKQIAAGDYQKT